MTSHFKTWITGIIVSVAVTGCGSSGDVPTAELGYVDVSSSALNASPPSVNNIRAQALQETATELGAQGALAWRAEQINNALDAESAYLTSIFDFNQLLINNNVLPPVLSETSGDINLDNDDTVRVSNKTYKIISPARFVTAPPSWRDYLWMNYSKPQQPDISLLPKNGDETQIWNYYLKKGWEQGLTQAN